MGWKTANRRKSKKLRLFGLQDGKCYWCAVPMELTFHEVGKQWDTLATLDHLDDRFSPVRGKMPGYRIVLACNKCNWERGARSQAEQPIEDLHTRAKRHPQKNPPNTVLADKLVEALWARSSTGSEQRNSTPHVGGSNPSALTNSDEAA